LAYAHSDPTMRPYGTETKNPLHKLMRSLEHYELFADEQKRKGRIEIPSEIHGIYSYTQYHNADI
jgi:hypothetical protein